MAIDYGRRSQKSRAPQIDKEALLEGLTSLRPKDRKRLSAALKDEVYNSRTLERANEVLTHLENNGHLFDLEPRRDGRGVFAKLKGTGGSQFRVTLATSDFTTAKGVDVDGSEHVGNVSVDGRNYAKRGNFVNKGGPTDLIDALMGERDIEIQPSDRASNNFETRYLVLDDNGEVVTRFFKDKPRDADLTATNVNLDDVTLPEGYDLEDVVSDLDDDFEIETSSVLHRMALDTKHRIAFEKDENDLLYFDNNGIIEEEFADDIDFEITDDSTLAGLDLDTLIKFNDRRDVSNAIALELQTNPEFTLDTEDIKGEQGLKNILMENLAGLQGERVEASELGDGYEDVLNTTRQKIERYGVDVSDIYFDNEHVIHWNGVHKYADKKGNQKEVGGRIGQVFLPDEKGLIRTEFKTLEGESERNYSMVPGYEAYFINKDKKIPKVKTVKQLDADGIERMYAADESGEKPFLFPQVNPATGERELMPFKAEAITSSWIQTMNNHVDNYNKRNPDAPLEKMGYIYKEPNIGERLRLRGYNQQLDRNIQSVVTRQIALDNVKELDGSSLNKLYHGEVYNMRVTPAMEARDGVVETLASRVKFPEEVMQMSAEELGADFEKDSKGGYVLDKNGDFVYEKTTHRDNLPAYNGIFDKALSSDGQSLGLVRYLVKDTMVNEKTGEIRKADDANLKRAPVFDHIPFTHSDPGDRALMAANQYMKARDVSEANVALMTYKGLTFEDCSVVSKAYAERQGAIVNGYDEEGHPIPLRPGDKISDLHGNKSTISYVADPETDPLFKEYPDIDVVMNPYSVPSRMNTGLAHEMRANGEVTPIMRDGEEVGEMGRLNVVITDITAEAKTQTYERELDADGNVVKAPSRKGRSFGVQEAWVGVGLGLTETMKEVYENNTKPYESIRAYMNVTGLDIDSDGVVVKGQGFQKDVTSEDKQPVGCDIVEPTEQLDLPKDASMMKLPVPVVLTSGISANYMHILDEKHRRTFEMYDGRRTPHDYTGDYKRLSDASLKFMEKFDAIDEKSEVDLSTYNTSDPKDFNELLKVVSAQDREELERARDDIQGHVDGLSNKVINDKLGGRMVEDEYGNRHKDGPAVKRSIVKKEIMGKQVPNSATAVVTADPTVDMNTLRVSPDIYEKMDLKYEDDRVLLWRDPALHDGSMRSFHIEKDESLVGVAINPLVTESFGMDFDGDTVGIYAPKSRGAQKELAEKASIEANLIDPTSEKFTGNVSMDFVTMSKVKGYVGEKPTVGPLAGQTFDTAEYNEAGQLRDILTEYAKEDGGYEKINEMWKETVCSDDNIGAARIKFSTKEKFKESLLEMAEIGAKGKPQGIESEVEKRTAQRFEGTVPYASLVKEQNKNSMRYLKEDDPKRLLPSKPTVMTYYNRGEAYAELLEKAGPDFKQDLSARRALEFMNTSKIQTGITPNKQAVIDKKIGSLGLDYDNTRKAQGGKVDLTGRAGAKSQLLVGLMYEDKDSAIAAMEVTEPLTQATLKLKHDPSDEPKIQKLLTDYDELLRNGGETRGSFKSKFNKMYDAVGLDVNDKHLDKVFDALSETKDSSGRTVPTKDAAVAEKSDSLHAAGNSKTVPIKDKEAEMSPLMQVNLNGYDALLDMANENRDILRDKMFDKPTNKELISLKDGNSCKIHVPKDLDKVTLSSRKEYVHNFVHDKSAIMAQLEQEKETYAEKVAERASKREQMLEERRAMRAVKEAAPTISNDFEPSFG